MKAIIANIANNEFDFGDVYFLTNKEVAKLLRTTEATLRKRIQNGEYREIYIKEGKYTLWNKSKLFNYLGVVA